MTDSKYVSSFSAFFRNLTTCSGSSMFTSLGQPPSVCKIPRSAKSTTSVFAYITTTCANKQSATCERIYFIYIKKKKNVWAYILIYSHFVCRPMYTFISALVHRILQYPLFVQTWVGHHVYHHGWTVIAKPTLPAELLSKFSVRVVNFHFLHSRTVYEHSRKRSLFATR